MTMTKPLEHKPERLEVAVAGARPDLEDPRRVMHRLVKRTTADHHDAAHELDPEVPVDDALGLILEQPARSPHPPVPEHRVPHLEAVVGEPEGDGGGTQRVLLRQVRGVRTPEGVEALLRMRAPPPRLAETLEVLGAEFLALGERGEVLVGLRPGTLVQRFASTFEGRGFRHEGASAG
jgi:hypothetical protein